MLMKENNGLTTAPIPGLVRMIAIPASIGFFFNTMYNVVDTFYAGLVSTTAIAALALSFPVFFVIIAMGSGISTGASALIATELGAGREDQAKRYVSQALGFTVLVSIVLSLIGIAVAPALFRLLGATGAYLDLALAYMDIIFSGAVFFLLTFVLNSTLTAQGDTKTFRNVLIAGFFLNLLLDPWFIYGGLGLPALGLAGVAWATVLIQLLSTLYIGYRAVKSGLLCGRCFNWIVPERKYYAEISRQGFPASLNMMTVAIGIFVITWFVSRYGQAAVAAYGITARVDQLALLPNIGLNIAALTLVGQNRGAGKFSRISETLAVSLRYGIYVATVGAVLTFVLARPLMGVFTRNPDVIAIGVAYLHISVLVYWAYMILYITVSALQGLKKPLFAVWIGFYRQLAAPVLIFYLLAVAAGWGLVGIWWGIFLINWSAVAITYIYARPVMKAVTAGRLEPSGE